MSFPFFIFLNFSNISNHLCKKSCGKERNFDFSHVIKFSLCKQEKASASTFRVQSSITVEAAFCIPIFVYAVICLTCLIEMRGIQDKVRSGLQTVGKEYVLELREIPYLPVSVLETKVMEALGDELTSNSLIEHEAGEFDMSDSYYDPLTGTMKLAVEYRLKIPIPLFRIRPILREEEMFFKCWTGYQSYTGLHQGVDQEMVFITKYGIVYHKDQNCTYLEPSVRAADYGEVSSLRNKDGSIYYPCPRCGKHIVGTQTVYVTDYGTCFHTSAACTEIKRDIMKVPISEVKGRGACSKCCK